MNIVFDFDGTLNISERTYMPAFETAYAWALEQGYTSDEIPDCDEVGYWIGRGAAELWNRFFPDMDEADRTGCVERMRSETARLAASGSAELYPGIEEALATLHGDGHRLIMLTNCGRAYLKAHRETLGLDRFFTHYCCGEDHNWAPKEKLLRGIVTEFSEGTDEAQNEFIVVGDRFHDIEAAVSCGIPSIGCAYGYGEYGELDQADIIVAAPRELLGAIEALIARA